MTILVTGQPGTSAECSSTTCSRGVRRTSGPSRIILTRRNFRTRSPSSRDTSADSQACPRRSRASIPCTSHRLPTPPPDALALAKQAGVRHVVDLSGPHDGHWGDVARAVEASGIEWTHLWPGEFMENAGILAPQIAAGDTVREPYPTAANAPIAMNDIAEVAAVALLEDGHVGASYELTGPETITRDDLVRELGAALGRNIEYRQVSLDEAVDVLTPAMGEYARWYLEGMASLVDAPPQEANRLVEQLTGRPATTFAQWASAHVDEFR